MANDYISSKYHLSDRSSPPGGDDFVTYDGFAVFILRLSVCRYVTLVLLYKKQRLLILHELISRQLQVY